MNTNTFNSIILAFGLTIFNLASEAQEYKRNTFDYVNLASENFPECNDDTYETLDKSLQAIQQNQSKFAVSNSEQVYNSNKDCFAVYDVYGYSLFRNGKWFEGLQIIEEGIKKFGSVPELIKRKSDMSLEMAQLGIGQKNIDGNSVYKSNSVEYEEEQFILENYKSALIDLEYLAENYNRAEEVFYIAKIHQVLGQYDKSNEWFNKLTQDEKYKYEAIFNIADNYISQNKLKEAETELNKVLKDNPKSGVILEKLADIYRKQGEKDKANEFEMQGIYYNNIPYFSDIEYSAESYKLLILFGTDEASAQEKIDKLNEVYKQKDPAYTTDLCLTILLLHANHGNGVEGRATEILESIGKPAVEKVNLLFQQDVSTCTITYLGDVMASAKEESSWELMTQYLPYIANMPMTLIPPNLPEKMIKFDEQRGLIEILKVVKPLLDPSSEETDDPMAELAGFGQYVYYSALKDIKKSKVKKVAKELNYTDKELNLLEKKLE